MNELQKSLIRVRVGRNQCIRDMKNGQRIYRELYATYVERYDKLIEEILNHIEINKFQEVLK